MKVFFHTLGCKVNQCEAESLAKSFENQGNTITTKIEDANIIVLGTCAVTNMAERKSRQAVSKLHSKNPNAKIRVFGCASQKDANSFKKFPFVESVVGTTSKNKLTECGFFSSQIKDEHFEEMEQSKPLKARAHIKIQDGCSNFCSYCIIPHLRGKSRSRELGSILKEAEEVSKTTSEIVITGINISDYKINGAFGLGELMENLSHLPCRIRLGSLENGIISNEFLRSLSSMKNFCPHFHLSLQSGSTTELERMNRKYAAADFLNQVERIRKFFPLASITTDFIVGFPEETDEEFQESVEFVKKCKFQDMHIFPYSIREGTPAEKMKQVSKDVVKKRIAIMNETRMQMSQECLESMKGKTFNVLIEKTENGKSFGKTENFIDVVIKKTHAVGSIVRHKI